MIAKRGLWWTNHSGHKLWIESEEFIPEAVSRASMEIADEPAWETFAGEVVFYGDKAEANRAIDLVDKIRDFRLEENLSVAGHGAGGTVQGSISGGNSAVLIQQKGYFAPAPRNVNPTKMWTNLYIGTAVHEIMHLAGRGVFGDWALAQAAFNLGLSKTEVKNPDTNDIKEIFAYSDAWNTALARYCGAR